MGLLKGKRQNEKESVKAKGKRGTALKHLSNAD
jgi:hypothetical protein